MKIGVTGSAGFIGMHLTRSLLEAGHEVVGVDSLQPAYGSNWSQLRAENLKNDLGFDTTVCDLSDCLLDDLVKMFYDCETIILLAAWPGVRKGQLSPALYAKHNIFVFSKMLEATKKIKPNSFMYASSSSVYGDLAQTGPVRESDATGLNLKSYYAATKWINEIEARAFQVLVEFPITALRFFTLYGPWGRPDMAYWGFLEKIKNNQQISLYGHNGGSRNFTYISDAVDILNKIINVPLSTKHRALNIACGEPTETIELLDEIANFANSKVLKKVIARPSVDVEKTWADLKELSELIELPNQTPISEGVANFVSWYENLIK
jgi:UDP-glucuronate 4-epimerase